jgi:hypothetical protein
MMNSKRIPPTIVAAAVVVAIHAGDAGGQVRTVSPTIPARAIQTSWTTRPTDHFEIYYRLQQNERVIEAVAREAEQAYSRVSFDLKYEMRKKVPLILVPSDRELPRDEDAAGTVIRASGSPDGDHLLLSLESVENRPTVLVHELTHQFEFEMIPRSIPLPEWVLEGLADHEAGVWTTADVLTMRDAAIRDRIPQITSLMADRLWGHALLDFVAAEFGNQGVQQYLTALRGSAATDGNASRIAFGLVEDDFDWAFKRFIRSRFLDR